MGCTGAAGPTDILCPCVGVERRGGTEPGGGEPREVGWHRDYESSESLPAPVES